MGKMYNIYLYLFIYLFILICTREKVEPWSSVNFFFFIFLPKEHYPHPRMKKTGKQKTKTQHKDKVVSYVNNKEPSVKNLFTALKPRISVQVRQHVSTLTTDVHEEQRIEHWSREV